MEDHAENWLQRYKDLHLWLSANNIIFYCIYLLYFVCIYLILSHLFPMFILEWRKVKLTDTCSGDVFVHTRNGCSPVSFEGWTQSEGDRLCKDLDCGKSMPPKSYKTPQKTSFWNGNFTCANVTNPKNIWDCENNALSTQEQQLYIECEGKFYFGQIVF